MIKHRNSTLNIDMCAACNASTKHKGNGDNYGDVANARCYAHAMIEDVDEHKLRSHSAEKLAVCYKETLMEQIDEESVTRVSASVVT